MRINPSVLCLPLSTQQDLLELGAGQ